MQLNRGAVGGAHGCVAPDGMQLLCRERELVAQLHELLFPSTPPPSAAGGSMSWSSSSADLSLEHCSLPVKAPAASCGKRRGKGSKRVREGHPQEEQKQRGACSTATKAARGSRRRKEGTTTTTIVTTVPDFDGYQWKKYGQKRIVEAAKYPRSYYRCTNSMDQACPAKRTVQRNDDDGDNSDGGPPKYTVVYISEHSCKAAEAVAAPVILETTVVRTKTPHTAAEFPTSSSAVSTGTQSSASSGITWSGCTVAGANPTPPSERGDCSSLFAVHGDCWEWDPALTSFQDMDFAGPIMSPVHVAATDGSWINSDLFVNESPFVLNSCQLFGF